MLQKRKTTVWTLLASLMVISIFISCFATSATRIYAEQAHYPIDVKVYRAANSTVGCVVITRVTDFATKTGDWIQVRLPVQNTLVYAHTYDSEDRLTIKSYPDAGCQDGSGTSFFDDLVRHLPLDCGHPANANPCRNFSTPVSISGYPIDVKLRRGINSTVGCVVITKVTDPTTKGGPWEQVPLPVQNVLVAAKQTYYSEDSIIIKNYPDGQCQNGSGTAFLFGNLVSRLPHDCARPVNANPCKYYETPAQA